MTSSTDASLRMPAGSARGPTITKSLCMTSRPSTRSPASTYGPLRRRRVDEDDVGVASRGHAQRRARADGDHLDVDPALRLEARHQHVEQPAVLRAGRRRQDDRALRLGVGIEWQAGRERKEQCEEKSARDA